MLALGSLCATNAPSEGAVVCLFGDIGYGKSVFARGFVRGMVGEPSLTVCSPTFLLTQEYSFACGGRGEEQHNSLVHADLYRLSSGDDLRTLGLPSVALQSTVGDATPGFSLVEWPEVLVNNPEARLRNRLDVEITRDYSDAGDLDFEELENATRTVLLKSEAWPQLFTNLLLL